MKKKKAKKWKKKMPHQEEPAAREDIFEQFLPVELLAMMGIHGGLQKSAEPLKEQKELQAVILNANIAGFKELIHNMQIKEVYALINQALSFSIPVIYGNNGMIDSFEDAGVTALFTGREEDGINAAISICEKIINAEDKETYQNFTIGLSSGTVMAGVVGYGGKLSVLTLSAYTGMGEFLQKTAYKYYARILAAECYVKKIEGFEKNYNYRLLGLFYIRDIRRAEKIFDIFDGDRTDIRNKKRKTKLLFEKGVSLFMKREFAQARGYFIEVLKADHSDRAAREYVFLCGRYSSMGEEKAAEAEVYIECL